jgi:hypothetical protein
VPRISEVLASDPAIDLGEVVGWEQEPAGGDLLGEVDDVVGYGSRRHFPSVVVGAASPRVAASVSWTVISSG